MSDWKFLLASGLIVITLVFCLWKTQADWQQSGFGWRTAFGAAASLGAFLCVAFLFVGSVMSLL